MEDTKSYIEPLIEKLMDYKTTSFELMRLRFLDKSADSLSTLASRLLAMLSVFVFVLMVSIGAALWIGDLLGEPWYGFFCVAGFYGILGFILYFLMHNQVKKGINNSIISQTLN